MRRKYILTFVIAAYVVLCVILSGCIDNETDQIDTSNQLDQTEHSSVTEQKEETAGNTVPGETKIGTHDILKSLDDENIEDYDDLNDGIFPLLKNLGDGITYEEAVKLGFTLEDSENAAFSKEWKWCRSAQLKVGDGKYLIYIYCIHDSPVTAVQLKIPGEDVYENTYYNDESLYNYVRHLRDHDGIIDREAYEKYGTYAQESAGKAYDIRCSETEGLKALVLKRFEEIWHGVGSNGEEIKLFRFDYVMEADLNIYRGAGGEYLDSDCMIEGSNGMYGQLIVKLEDDKVVKTRILEYDEMIPVDSNNDEEIEGYVYQFLD